MFITNAVLANNILDRSFFDTKKEAIRFAKEQSREENEYLSSFTFLIKVSS